MATLTAFSVWRGEEVDTTNNYSQKIAKIMAYW
jgi:hypothetical protein